MQHPTRPDAKPFVHKTAAGWQWACAEHRAISDPVSTGAMARLLAGAHVHNEHRKPPTAPIYDVAFAARHEEVPC
jgi:hypothetical protein